MPSETRTSIPTTVQNGLCSLPHFVSHAVLVGHKRWPKTTGSLKRVWCRRKGGGGGDLCWIWLRCGTLDFVFSKLGIWVIRLEFLLSSKNRYRRKWYDLLELCVDVCLLPYLSIWIHITNTSYFLCFQVERSLLWVQLNGICSAAIIEHLRRSNWPPQWYSIVLLLLQPPPPAKREKEILIFSCC